ncbi:AzlC family ABC transporter permease [Hasllibacter sp. MH4015]|uniref:AzlC family ABC transporter permease n=1 Tax=Hasllibacter sp. MH4015 TaxID=2854029 RepID=UPI001CD4A5F2|nr:AzlC family ABC transporter permease [Hasllibacter sp. MH4015]
MQRATTSRNAFWRGARDCGPFVLVAGPFGMLFGVIGTEAGLNIAQVMGFSVVVIAGAAQLAALQLMIDQAPTVIVLLSAIAVNLRMAMYSASLAPYLGKAPLWQRALVGYMNVDQTYAVSILKYEAEPSMNVAERMAYFFGTCLPVVPVWYAATLAGAVLGQSVPGDLGLEFAVPIAFLAIVAPALRTLAHVAAAGASIVLAILFAGLPYNLGLMPAGIGAMIVGAEVERRMGAAFPPPPGGRP